MEFIETCRRFIEIDSSPNQGTAEIAKFAAELCRAQGMAVELHQERHDGVEQANLVASFPGHRGDADLLLQTHLDTMDPGAFGLWSVTGHNPFNATISGERIYGLGAANVKLDFLCKLRALKKLENKKLKMRPVLAATFGAESGTAGAIRLIRKKMTNARVALIGAPTNLCIWHAAKGTASVEIAISFSEEEKKFRAEHDHQENSSSQSKIFNTHGKRPEENSANAIVNMLKFLSQLPDGIAVLDLDGGVDKKLVPSLASLEFDVVDVFDESMAKKLKFILQAIERVEKDFENYQDVSFDSPFPTLNIGMVRTHEEYVLLSGMCTVPPVVEEATYQRWMEDLRRACQAIGADFRITEYFPPFKTPAETPAVRRACRQLQEMNLEGRPATAPRSSEANTFSRLGIQCLMFGAGVLDENARVENENVSLQALDKAGDFYERFIEDYCS